MPHEEEKTEVKRTQRPLNPKLHEDSDHEYDIEYSDGSKATQLTMLGCSSPKCEAEFTTTRKRSWHIQTRHPGEYSGPTEAMSWFSDILKSHGGGDGDLGTTHTFKRGELP